MISIKRQISMGSKHLKHNPIKRLKVSTPILNRTPERPPLPLHHCHFHFTMGFQRIRNEKKKQNYIPFPSPVPHRFMHHSCYDSSCPLLKHTYLNTHYLLKTHPPTCFHANCNMRRPKNAFLDRNLFHRDKDSCLRCWLDNFR